MDAAVMDGQTLRAGAASGLRRVKNPIDLARAIMEKSPHVFFASEGAELFAEEIGLEMVDPKYFYTEERWRALERVRDKQIQLSDQDRHGTVGAVALDQTGHLAAATSTGGNTNKLPGRIGDTPIIGAGTYANDRTCAVSATGDGENFIRAVAGHDLSALMEYRGMPLKDAAELVIRKVTELGGSGGLIAVDGAGNIAMPFSTAGMYRGFVGVDGQRSVAIYR
jgi:beta-aspartyl-peptidase (threonine type)